MSTKLYAAFYVHNFVCVCSYTHALNLFLLEVVFSCLMRFSETRSVFPALDSSALRHLGNDERFKYLQPVQ